MIWKDTKTGKIYHDGNPNLQLDYNEKGEITEESLKKNFKESDWHDGIIVIPTDNNFAIVLQFNGGVFIAENVATAEQFEEGKGYCKVTTTNNKKRIMTRGGTLILPSAGKLISQIFNDPLSVEDISDEDLKEATKDLGPIVTTNTFLTEVQNIADGITTAGFHHYTIETLQCKKQSENSGDGVLGLMMLALVSKKIMENTDKFNNMLRDFGNNKLQEWIMASMRKGYEF